MQLTLRAMLFDKQCSSDIVSWIVPTLELPDKLWNAVEWKLKSANDAFTKIDQKIMMICVCVYGSR